MTEPTTPASPPVTNTAEVYAAQQPLTKLPDITLDSDTLKAVRDLVLKQVDEFKAQAILAQQAVKEAQDDFAGWNARVSEASALANNLQAHFNALDDGASVTLHI